MRYAQKIMLKNEAQSRKTLNLRYR